MLTGDFWICNNEINVKKEALHNGALLGFTDELDCVEVEITSMSDALLLKGIADEVIERLRETEGGEK